MTIAAAPLLACIGFALAAQSQSGPKAMPENVHRPERYDHMTTEPRRPTERPQGLLQYDLDSAYLPDAVGGYVEILVNTDSSTVAAENEEILAEIATMLKEKAEVDVWVTAQLQSKSPSEARETALAVEAVVDRLRRFGIEDIAYRIWQPDEKRPATPLDVVEIRVLTSPVKLPEPVS